METSNTQTQVITTGDRGTLQMRDLVRGLLITVASAALTIIYESIQAGNWRVDWEHVLHTSVVAGIVYIIKQYLEPAKIIIQAPQPFIQRTRQEGAHVVVGTTQSGQIVSATLPSKTAEKPRENEGETGGVA